MRQKNRTFLPPLKWLITLTGIVSIVMIFFLSAPKVRHGTFLFALELPGIATRFALKQYVPLRRFDKALPWLERELDLINWFAPRRNHLLPGLINNTAYVFERTRFPEEFVLFLPFLKQLVATHPELYPARIWLARALKETDPASAFEHLEAATRLSAADERPYRIAIALALKEKSSAKLKDWCNRYQTHQFGGLDPIDYDNFIHSIGLRNMVLEVINPLGNRQLTGNMGIQLGESKTYEFILEKSGPVIKMRLHLGIVPGIAVSLKSLKFYLKGKTKKILNDGWVLTSWSGFHLDDGRVITISKDGETIDIHPPKEGFGEMDRVELKLRLDRLGLANPGPCGEKNSL